MALLIRQEGWQFATSDGGADTCVLGTGWRIVDVLQDRSANLIGFDANCARKSNLAIVTADALIVLPNGEHAIIRIHEAVYNPDSPTTLLSECQIHEHGIIVDSVSKRHLAALDGSKGKQSIIIDEGTSIPFQLRGGLMTFKFRTPTDDDYDHIGQDKVITLTSDQRWEPQALYNEDAFDDDATIYSVNSVHIDMDSISSNTTSVHLSDDCDSESMPCQSHNDAFINI